MEQRTAIELENIEFSYPRGDTILNIDALTALCGERIFLFGPSGSGKTTLLGIIGGILQPRQGKVSILGQNLAALSSGERDHFRGRHIGYIFQMFNLLPFLSVRENIMLPALIRKGSFADPEYMERALAIATTLGISAIFDAEVSALSVGQQQRVAAARALVARPELVIADEPTSALDTDHRAAFLDLLFQICDQCDSTLLFVSHDHALSAKFSRKIALCELNQAAKSN